MDSWEWNKIAGGLLGVLLFVIAVMFIAQAIFKAPQPKIPGYAVAVPEEVKPAAAVAAAEILPDFAVVLPAADAEHGKTLAQQCRLCHDESKNGANRIGPSLWGIVGRPRATAPGYVFSSAMSATRDPWTYDRLFTFLRSPNTAVPGTRMSFAGLRSAEDRADLLAYLRTLGDTPAPLPPAKK